ncbi:HPr family phosphocarrier protein [Streptomyces sp. NPDC014006]|uniref:HPr family phosphocarrier protein n=1 Tax=Streptomyces sp. NPDC014006 TaxID=3364870 RepID=UPI0036F52F57
MAQRVVTIGSHGGLHARPAATFAQAAGQAPVAVTIAVDGKEPVAASSLLGVMALGARHGDQVRLTAHGEKAETVLDELAQLLEGEHDA